MWYSMKVIVFHVVVQFTHLMSLCHLWNDYIFSSNFCFNSSSIEITSHIPTRSMESLFWSTPEMTPGNRDKVVTACLFCPKFCTGSMSETISILTCIHNGIITNKWTLNMVNNFITFWIWSINKWKNKWKMNEVENWEL